MSGSATGCKYLCLFIIRFYQLQSPGTRSAYLEALNAITPSANLIDRVVKEAKAALAPFDMRDQQTEAREVSDRFGLGRLLQLVCAREFRGTGEGLSLKALARRAAERRLRFTQSWFDRLHHGHASVRVEELLVLAEEIYEVEPMLLYDFLFPAQRNAVAVRRQDDFRPVPEPFIRSTDVSYQVPCRRLADSDIAIARLRLAPGAGTPVNRHPGHELLLPLAGACEVRFGNVKARLDAQEHRYAHYHSSRVHEVVNMADEPAEQLVFRFYE